MKITNILSIISLGFIVSLSASAQSPTLCGASPYPVKITQPDGSQVEVVGKGNAIVNYTETVDGYSIVKNNVGLYEYAKKDKSGKLVATGILVHEVNNRNAAEINLISSTQKHLQMSKEQVNAKLQSFKSLYENKTAGTNKMAAANGLFPNKGNRKVLMLLIQYPDLAQINTVGQFENLMNQSNYQGTGSYHDYYIANSFNQLNLSVDVFGWYTASKPYTYYGVQNGYGRAEDLGVEALDAAEAAGVDFSQYDNDKDGYVDGIMFVHSGIGAENGSQQQYIWSHRGALRNKYRQFDGVVINDYMFQPERDPSGMSQIGVFCHEFGHGLGLPDLYDIDYSSEGVGDYSVMGGGCYLNRSKTPSSFDAWCKIDMDWMKATVLDTTRRDSIYTLPSASINSIAYKVYTGRPNEYFLLENREPNGYDKYLPSHGLAIWHIDTLKTLGFRLFGDNSVNSDEKNPGVGLVQADGKNDLFKKANRGDSGDLYPGISNNRFFTNTSNPAALFNDGSQALTRIENITRIGDTLVQFGYSKTNCLASLNPVANPSYCENSSLKLSTSAIGIGYQWYKNGSPIGGAINQTYDVNAEGDYYVKITNGQNCTSPTSTTSSITVYESFLLSKPSVIVTGKVLTSSYVFGNQWKRNGVDIVGANQQNYVITASSGKYNVVVTGDSVCFASSDTVNYGSVGIADITGLAAKIEVYPNPSYGKLYIQISDKYVGENVTAELFDTKGALVYTTKMQKGSNQINTEIFEKGIYYLKLNNSVVRKVVIN